jgi:hypothetical protein
VGRQYVWFRIGGTTLASANMSSATSALESNIAIFTPIVITTDNTTVTYSGRNYESGCIAGTNEMFIVKLTDL